MSKISQKKQEKVMSNIVSILFENSPEALFTSEISKTEGRDEEFVKKLLLDLHKKGLVIPIKKNPKGNPYLRRIRWRLSDNAYIAYKQRQ